MSEPIAINPRTTNVVVSADGASDATALRELADWIDAQEGDWMVMSVTAVHTVNWGGPRLTEERDFSAIIERIDDV